MNSFLHILLIEDNLAQVELIQEMLTEVRNVQFNLTSVRRLSDGLQRLREAQFDIILLDLSLPDSYGLDTLVQLKRQTSTVPIIVLTNLDNRTIALESVRQGAQDYLVKGRFDGELLLRSMNYAIERQRIKEELRQQIERERLIARMIERIRNSLDLNEILQTTVKEVQQFLNADRVLIYCSQNEQQSAIVAELIKVQSSRTRTPSLEDIQAIQAIHAPILEPDYVDFLINSLVRAVLTVPIWQRTASGENRLWGQLIAHDYSGSRRWQPWEIEFLTQLANQVAISIQQSELYRAVEQLATIDGLTGVANRRQFDQVLKQEWQRLAREKQPLSVVMCDVDFFSNYNNYYGHLAGDTCLRQVAQAIGRASQRPADVLARYGGEEFAVILPCTDIVGALIVAQNIRNQLISFKLPHASSPVSDYVTLSMGIATQIPRINQNPFTLVNFADQALLRAKEQGRDRIVQD